MSLMKCLNLADPAIAQVVNKYGETVVSKALNNYNIEEIENLDSIIESYINNNEKALKILNYHKNSDLALKPEFQGKEISPKIPIKTSKTNFEVIPTEDISVALNSIQSAVKEIKNILPKEIEVQIIKDYKEVLSQGRLAVGVFKDGIIKLSSLAHSSVAYHEAFHAVFRTMLSNKEQKNIIEQAKKYYLKPKKSDLEFLKETHKVSEQEAINLFYEETLGDEFSIYFANKENYDFSKEHSKEVHNLFERLILWIKEIFSNKLTVEKLFNDISIGKYASKVPNISRTIAYSSSHPEYTAKEVQEFTKSLTYAIFKDVSELKDLHNLETDDIYDKAIEAILETREYVLNNYEDELKASLLYKLENLLTYTDFGITLDPFWRKQIDSYIKDTLKLKKTRSKEREEDAEIQDIIENEGAIKEHYKSSDKNNASKAIKFMLAMVPQVKYQEGKLVNKRSPVTGMYIFHDSMKIDSQLKTLLHSVVPIKNNKGEYEDVFNLMLEKILVQSKYSPELLHLYNNLKEASETTKTQFVVAMSMQRGNYINHEISGTVGNVKSNIITSEADSKSWAIFEQWASNFDKLFGKYEGKRYIYDPIKINNFVGKGGYLDQYKKLLDDFSKVLDKTNPDKLLEKSINRLPSNLSKTFYGLFREVGVKLESNTWNKIFEDYAFQHRELLIDPSKKGAEDLKQQLQLKVATMDSIVNDLKWSLQGLEELSGKDLNRDTNLLYDQKSFFRKKLADNEASFKVVQGEAMVNGPEGKIWVYQNHSFKSLILQSIKNNDLSHLIDMSNSLYNRHSYLLDKLLVKTPKDNGEFSYSLNKEYADSLEIQFYGNNVYSNEESGLKAKDLKNPDKLHDVFTKYAHGIYVGLAEADKTQQNYLKIPEVIKSGYSYTEQKGHTLPKNSNTIKILTRYLYAELERIKAAYDFSFINGEFKQKIFNEDTGEYELPENFISNYHYFEDKNGILHPGNAFNSFIFPNLNLRELEIIKDGVLNFPTSLEELESNDNIYTYLKDVFIKRYKEDVKTLNKNKLIKIEAGKLVNLAIDSKLLPEGVSQEYALNTLIADFTLNGIVANVEDTMFYTGDPAFYKVKPKFEEVKDAERKITYKLKNWKDFAIYSDFMKRIPAPTAAGLMPRIYQEKGQTAVNPYFSSVVVENIDNKPSDYFKDDKVFNEVAKTINKKPSEVKELLAPYLNINQTDAQAWITLDLYKERLLSYGKWTFGENSHEEAFNIIKENEVRYKEGKEEIPLTGKQIVLLAQPLKTVHFELSKHPDLNILIPIYNKQSEAPLLPFITRNTSLDNLRLAMEELKIGHAAVLDARKVGSFNIAKITDSNKNLLEKDLLAKNLSDSIYMLKTQHVLLQTDLNAHLVGSTKVGSQTTKNILGAVEIDAEYVNANAKGKQMALMLEDKIAKLSNIGYKEFQYDLGFSNDQRAFTKNEQGVSSLVEVLIKTGKLNTNHLDALLAGVSIDSLPISTSIESTFANLNTKASVKLKQSGGAFIQLSNFGFVGKETSLSDTIKNGIVWLKNPSEPLLPMHVKEGEVKPAQVLLPHNVILKVLKEQLGINYSKMSSLEFQDLIHKGIIDKRVLEGLSYRIPNQAAGSNDAFEIVGFLPPEAGDTIVMYSDITVKTGSDFDIDKAYVILPEFYYDKKKNRIGYYTDENHSNLENRKKALANSRLKLMRDILMHPNAFLNVMSPLDNPMLSDLCKELFPEESINNDLQFFSATQQLENKKTFDDAKTLVGLIADHMVSHNLYKAHDIRFNNYYLGLGNKDSKGNTFLDKKETKETSTNISMLLGLYMNAIVDAAKDPFISRANINLKTANVAFTLIRAGVELDWVTSFMGQPIIKEYLEMQEVSEARFGDKKKVLDIIASKYGFKDDAKKLLSEKWISLKDKNGNIKITTKELQDFITNKDSLNYPQKLEQLNILAQFLQWQGQAKNVRDLIKVSKVDVNGSGKNLRYAKMMQNLFLKLASEETFLGLDSLFGYKLDEDGDIVFSTNEYIKEDGTVENYNSMIGTYYQNAINNFIEMFDGEFLQHTEAFNTSLENIASRSGYPYLLPTQVHEKIAQQITNELRASILSSTSLLKQSKEELQSLFYGDPSLKEDSLDNRKKSIFDRVREAQNNETLKNNLFISNLYLRVNRGGRLEKIYIPSNETTREVSDEFSSEWELLWNTNPGLAKDLMLYSFYTTGFTPSQGSFFKFIPFIKEIMIPHSKEIDLIKKEANKNFAYFQKFEDSVVKNLMHIEEIVPSINRKAIKSTDEFKVPVSKKIKEDGNTHIVRLQDLNKGFILTNLDPSAGYLAGLDDDGRPVYKKFIKVITETTDYLGEEIIINNLFELQGYINNGLTAVYLKTNKLGLNIGGLKVKEYSSKEDKLEDNFSLFNVNNLNEDTLKTLKIVKESLNINEPIFHTPIEEAKESLVSLYKEEVEKMSDPEIITQLKYCFNIG